MLQFLSFHISANLEREMSVYSIGVLVLSRE